LIEEGKPTGTTSERPAGLTGHVRPTGTIPKPTADRATTCTGEETREESETLVGGPSRARVVCRRRDSFDFPAAAVAGTATVRQGKEVARVDR
jgi:hypothetical protein